MLQYTEGAPQLDKELETIKNTINTAFPHMMGVQFTLGREGKFYTGCILAWVKFPIGQLPQTVPGCFDWSALKYIQTSVAGDKPIYGSVKRDILAMAKLYHCCFRTECIKNDKGNCAARSAANHRAGSSFNPFDAVRTEEWKKRQEVKAEKEKQEAEERVARRNMMLNTKRANVCKLWLSGQVKKSRKIRNPSNHKNKNKNNTKTQTKQKHNNLTNPPHQYSANANQRCVEHAIVEEAKQSQKSSVHRPTLISSTGNADWGTTVRTKITSTETESDASKSFVLKLLQQIFLGTLLMRTLLVRKTPELILQNSETSAPKTTNLAKTKRNSNKNINLIALFDNPFLFMTMWWMITTHQQHE